MVGEQSDSFSIDPVTARALLKTLTSAGMGLRVFDPDKRVRFQSPAIRQILGDDCERLLSDLVPAHRQSEVLHQLEQPASDQGTVNHMVAHLPQGRSLSVSEISFYDQSAQAMRLEVIRDVSAEQLAFQVQAIANTAFETQQALIMLGADRTIVRINKLFTRLTGYTWKDIQNKPVSILYGDAQRDIPDCLRQANEEAVDKLESWYGETTCRRKNGATFPAMSAVSVVQDAAGVAIHYVVSYYDITQRKLADAQILKLAFYDLLTELPNRHLLLNRLEQRLADSSNPDEHAALVFLDLDKFKLINDAHGHGQGDALLRLAAKRLMNSLPSNDTIYRFGDDEFVALIDGLGTSETNAMGRAQELAATLQVALSEPYALPEPRKLQGVSIGIRVFRSDGLGPNDVLRQAGLALQDAKLSRIRSISLYTAAMQTIIDNRNCLEVNLRLALEHGNLVLMYQPQIDRSGRLIGAEALLRWRDPQRGLIMPGQFIAHAEESGLIIPIGQWVLETACCQLACWSKFSTTRHLRLSVNISARQFRQLDFVECIKAIIAQSGANPKLLQLEITESVLLDDLENAVERMGALRDLGVAFSIDDFGTGYSSLSYLRRLPVDELKIDQSFTQDVNTDPENAAIVRAIIAMGRTLNLQVFAEGVEKRDQFDFLQKSGCDAFQGYLFGRPAASTGALLSAMH